MEQKPVRPVVQEEALYMITLPGGELRYMAPICETLFEVTVKPEANALWRTIIPEKWHAGILRCINDATMHKMPQPLLLDYQAHGEHCQEALRLQPFCDASDKVIAIAWYGAHQPCMDNHHYEMFHRSAIAQWIMDPRSVFHYLNLQHIHNREELDRAIHANPNMINFLRGLFGIIDTNLAALQFYYADNVDGFKNYMIANVSDAEVRNACYAILGMGGSPQRFTYQAEAVLPGKEKKSLWVSCEIPALVDMHEGMFISVLNITPLKQAEHDSEEREQFLGAILRAVPDILMVFDFKTRQPIFQNSDLTKLLGYTDQDLADTKGHILGYITHPDDNITGESLVTMYEQLAAGDVFETTLRLQHNNGEWHHFFFRSAALDKDEKGNVINAVVVARDITEVLKAQQILNKQQQHYSLLAENFSDVVITTDIRMMVNYVSPSVAHLLGCTPDEFITRRYPLSSFGIDEDEEARLFSVLASTVFRVDITDNDFSEVLESTAISATGILIPIELKISILRDEHKLLEGLLIVVRDITDRRKIDADQRMAAKVFENSMEAIYITNQHGEIVQVNNAFVRITGHKPEDVLGIKPSQLGAGWDDVDFQADIKPVLDKTGLWSGELMSRRANGEAFLVWMSISYVSDSRGKPLGMITSFRDITEAKNSEENIRKLAYYDPLTDLPNRMLFHDRLLQALQRANRNRHYIAILFMDLDGFKAVNDVLGHAVGDRLLADTAKRLKECIRSDDTLARMGGDEFTIVLNALTDKAAAENAAALVARKIIEKLNVPFNFDDKAASIGVSIGIALYPDDAIGENELIKLADTAMYHAKECGKNQYQFYTNDMHQRAEQRLEEEEEMRKALLNGELLLAFQPKLVAIDQSLYGFEALLRWQHPRKGMLLPNNFLRALNDLTLSVQIGEWVLDKACENLTQWHEDGHTHPVSINIFPHQYRDPGFVDMVGRVIARHRVSAGMITLEISERLIMEDLGFAYSVLTALKTLGVRIAIDDFATGQFSLGSFNRLPVDEIKIDRQFISHIDTEPEQFRLVKAIINIANTFGCDVVAEGVEREEQLQALLHADCPKVQGFLFYRPLLKADMAAYFLQKDEKNH